MSPRRSTRPREHVTNILNAILGAGDGQAVGALAQQFGLSNDQASSAVGALLPALAGGLQRNVTQQGGLEALVVAGFVGKLFGGGSAARIGLF